MSRTGDPQRNLIAEDFAGRMLVTSELEYVIVGRMISERVRVATGVYSDKGTARLKSIDVWQMESARLAEPPL